MLKKRCQGQWLIRILTNRNRDIIRRYIWDTERENDTCKAYDGPDAKETNDTDNNRGRGLTDSLQKLSLKKRYIDSELVLQINSTQKEVCLTLIVLGGRWQNTPCLSESSIKQNT